MSASREPLTLDERRRLGRSLRSNTPRLSLAVLAERPERYDAIDRLRQQGRSRNPRLLGLRYQRMLENPLAFYRGAALLMAEDLARGASSSLEVQICGDAHLANFGVFASPERRMVFDVNDFDETTVGPFEWDVKRLVTSLVIASHQLGHDARQQETIAVGAAREYRSSMARFAQQTRLEVWYASLELDAVMRELRGFFSDSAKNKIDDVIRHTQGGQGGDPFAKVLEYGENGPTIIVDPPHFTRLDDPASLSVGDAFEIVAGYASTLSSDRQMLLGQFSVRDAARHVVGIGSVGTECLAVLLVGRDDHDPLLLQVKQGQLSVVDQALGRDDAGPAGERVVRGQRLLQATPDVLLGWHSLEGGEQPRSFSIRQLYDRRAAIDVEALDESLLVAYGRLCAWTLARAHARSGRSAEIAGYLGKSHRFDEALAAFALAYRDRNHADFEALKDVVARGGITVAT